MRVCFFDIDGTLVATGGAGQRAFGDVFLEFFGVEELSGDVSFAGRSDRAIAMDLFRAHGQEPSDENWNRFRTRYVEQLAVQLPKCEGRVLPGVEALIAKLAALEEVEIGLLTGNIVTGAEAKLDHYGLWHHFLFGGFGDVHTCRNQIAAAAVEAAHRHAKSSPTPDDRMVVIGDTVHDITCAKSIGAYAVAVPTGFTSIDVLREAEPDLAVETLEDCEILVDWLVS